MSFAFNLFSTGTLSFFQTNSTKLSKHADDPPSTASAPNKEFADDIASLAASAYYLPAHHVNLVSPEPSAASASASASPSASASAPSEYIDKTNVTLLLSHIFPQLPISNLHISKLTGGITNMLLKCRYTNLPPQGPGPRDPDGPTNLTVLVRAYGEGTDVIIDRDREFVSHLHLHALKLAPALYARFGNGLVYGFIPGRSIHYTEMSHEAVMPFVAGRFGQWHALLDADTIQDGILRIKRNPKFRFSPSNGNSGKKGNGSGPFASDIWSLLDLWIGIMPDKPGKNAKSSLRRELRWLQRNIGKLGGPLIIGHCDLLSGNIVVPETYPEERGSFLGPSDSTDSASTKSTEEFSEDETGPEYLYRNPVQFIDYEYTMLAPRAFDLANHFMEWQGFACETCRIPSPSRDNETMRQFAKEYLTAFAEFYRIKYGTEYDDAVFKGRRLGPRDGADRCVSLFVDSDSNSQTDGDHITVEEPEINGLIDELALYWGMPGFYWGIWSSIQSTISLIDFDYGQYSDLRLEEYWRWRNSVEGVF